MDEFTKEELALISGALSHGVLTARMLIATGVIPEDENSTKDVVLLDSIISKCKKALQ